MATEPSGSARRTRSRWMRKRFIPSPLQDSFPQLERVERERSERLGERGLAHGKPDDGLALQALEARGAAPEHAAPQLGLRNLGGALGDAAVEREVIGKRRRHQ